MRRGSYIWLALLVACSAFLWCAITLAQQESESTESLVSQATLIFRGTVMRLHASTLPSVSPTDSTVVVRVDKVLDEPEGSPNLTGQEITLRLRAPGSVKVGEQAIFFTKGWLMGSSIAVIEIGRRPITDTALFDDVRASRQRVNDQPLQRELATAEAVVTGTVTQVTPAPIPHIGSEHDPDWHEAQISIDSVQKGQITSPSVSLLFPKSEDVVWKSSPKFHTGEKGIWLLHRNQVEWPKIREWYTAIKPLDFHPPQELPRIQHLMQSVR